MKTRRTTRRGPVANRLRRVAVATSNPSHPRVGLHTSQTRRTRAANGVTLRPDAARLSKFWDGHRVPA